MNWLRPFLSSAFARDSAELRNYLTKHVAETFELDAAGLASFRSIQKLVMDFIALGVPDYAAAADWERTGRCFEIVLDASALGGGAALFQLDVELGKPRPLGHVFSVVHDGSASVASLDSRALDGGLGVCPAACRL